MKKFLFAMFLLIGLCLFAPVAFADDYTITWAVPNGTLYPLQSSTLSQVDGPCQTTPAGKTAYCVIPFPGGAGTFPGGITLLINGILNSTGSLNFTCTLTTNIAFTGYNDKGQATYEVTISGTTSTNDPGHGCSWSSNGFSLPYADGSYSFKIGFATVH